MLRRTKQKKSVPKSVVPKLIFEIDFRIYEIGLEIIRIVSNCIQMIPMTHQNQHQHWLLVSSASVHCGADWVAGGHRTGHTGIIRALPHALFAERRSGAGDRATREPAIACACMNVCSYAHSMVCCEWYYMVCRLLLLNGISCARVSSRRVEASGMMHYVETP